MIIAFIIVLVIVLIATSVSINNKNTNTKNSKVVETFRIPTVEEQCSIEYFPLGKQYAPKYKRDYIFKTHYGTFSLHSTPCQFTLFRTEEEARNRIKEYLEWNGKDVQTIKY
jgi:hypothetical protein